MKLLIHTLKTALFWVLLMGATYGIGALSQQSLNVLEWDPEFNAPYWVVGAISTFILSALFASFKNENFK